MGDTGFEPVTSSLSRKHSTTELIAREVSYETIANFTACAVVSEYTIAI